jgi:hypothetical protein
VGARGLVHGNELRVRRRGPYTTKTAVNEKVRSAAVPRRLGATGDADAVTPRGSPKSATGIFVSRCRMDGDLSAD